MKRRIGALLVTLTLFGSVACSEPDEGTGLVRPRASAAPTSSSGSGGLNGGVTPDGSTDPIVQYVQLDVSTLSLNAPAADGIPPAGLTSTASLTARAILTDGQPDPSGVEWQNLDPQRLEVDASGVVSVKPGAAVGVTALTAVSKRNPALKAQAAVTITRDGILQITGLPEATSGYRWITVTRNGTTLKDQILTPSTRLRLPEGTHYEAQIQYIAGSETTVVGNFPDLALVANGMTIANVSP